MCYINGGCWIYYLFYGNQINNDYYLISKIDKTHYFMKEMELWQSVIFKDEYDYFAFPIPFIDTDIDSIEILITLMTGDVSIYASLNEYNKFPNSSMNNLSINGNYLIIKLD